MLNRFARVLTPTLLFWLQRCWFGFSSSVPFPDDGDPFNGDDRSKGDRQRVEKFNNRTMACWDSGRGMDTALDER